MKILGTYKVHYPANGITQTKVLISHEDYLEIMRMSGNNENEIKAQKAALKELTGGKEWFTDRSPYFEAIETGILNCNGIHECQLTKISTNGNS